MVAIPTFCDGILPAIFGAFGVLGHPLVSLRLRYGWCHIDLLFPHLEGILFFPSISLRLFELGCGKTPFFAIFDAEIFFFGLVLPFPVFVQRANRQQNVRMWIMSRRIWIMDGRISAVWRNSLRFMRV